MIKINTFLAVCQDDEADEYLIGQLVADQYFNITDEDQLQNCRHSLASANSTYISGYIEIEYYGQVYMGKEYRDYVIWMWFNISNGINSYVLRNGGSEFLFPDQPLYFCLTPQGDNVLFELKEANKSHQRMLFPKKEFTEALVLAGIDVVSRLLKYDSSDAIREMLAQFEMYKEIAIG